MTMEKIMTDIDLEILKKQIESLREEINTYIEYPEIFKDELIETSSKIDELINKYINVAK